MKNKTNKIFEEIKQLNDEVVRLQTQSQQIRLKYQKDEGIGYAETGNRYYDYFQNKRHLRKCLSKTT